MIKDLIVNLSLGDRPDPTANFALSMASQFNAHITGVAFMYEPVVPAIEMMPIPADIIEMQREENERLAAHATNRFEEGARRNAVSAEVQTLNETLTGAAETFARAARRFDLSVVSQPRPESPGSDSVFVEGALFSSGRPVLIVPYIQQAGLTLNRILMCWDGSRTAARAAADALPFFKRAKTTEIITVTDGSSQFSEVPGADIAKHLARHELNVELKRTVAGDIDAASVILSHAADTGADLIVMGGYGHSRWREFILGGVTRGLLTSMTVPTLMSH
jgi:nucleotide-binding universal stress UspA family protein